MKRKEICMNIISRQEKNLKYSWIILDKKGVTIRSGSKSKIL